MIQFLGRFWKALKQSFPDKSSEVKVTPDEFTARFIYQKNDWNKQPILKPKPKLFLPSMYEGQLETSVCVTSSISAVRIWEIANQARSPLPALAYAELLSSSIENVGLRILLAPDLERNYPEHAVIVGWPGEKPLQMELAIQLVASSTIVLAQ